MATTTDLGTDPGDEAAGRAHMAAALGLARRGLGQVWPNPAVGCVLVRDGRVVGRGWTQPGGRPHAEAEALARAGEAARGATAYVTLEPCSHWGRTPPCADALIAAGIARAVVATGDPDARVAGAGFARLREAGIPVALGLLQAGAIEVNAGFLMRVREGRPLITFKAATSLDGRIALASGESQWITGPAARARGHAMRAHHDAILVGIGTALADDPLLTCRAAGLEHRSPVRIVVDGRLRLPLTSRLAVTARDIPTWLIALEGADPARLDAYLDCGFEVLTVAPDEAGRPNLREAMAALGERGLTRVLVEGGGTVAASLLGHGLVDRVAWFRAPRLIGGDGLPVARAFGVASLAGTVDLVSTGTEQVGEDVLEHYAAKGR